MTVYFIGAGPGDPDLITVKGLRLISQAQFCLYAGSLVPPAIVDAAPTGATVIDTASLTLDQIIEYCIEAEQQGQDVARVHSGDPSLYGATGEQMRRLDQLGIDYEVIPGVPAYTAAAAKLKLELTVPEITQSVILTRTTMKSTAMPEGETLENFARTGAALMIHLSVRNLRHIERELIPYYGEDCPVIIAYRVGWPDEQFIHTQLNSLYESARKEKITRTALIMVGKGLETNSDLPINTIKDSALYSPDHVHILRPKRNED